jgi:hypothetical protein
MSYETKIHTTSLNVTGSSCALDFSGSSETVAFFKDDNSELLSSG